MRRTTPRRTECVLEVSRSPLSNNLRSRQKEAEDSDNGHRASSRRLRAVSDSAEGRALEETRKIEERARAEAKDESEIVRDALRDLAAVIARVLSPLQWDWVDIKGAALG
jgi:hypothetical protein